MESCLRKPLLHRWRSQIGGRLAVVVTEWHGSYSDAFGQEAISVQAEGRTLKVSIRGVLFTGLDFDHFEAPADLDPATPFDLRNGALSRYDLRWDMPVQIDSDAGRRTATVHCHLALDLDNPIHANREKLSISLEGAEVLITTTKDHAFFEGALADLQRQLPGASTIRTCISCAYSDYHPAGNGLSGSLACFRTVKAAYQQVASKQDIFQLWASHTETVRETHLCPDYARRGPHAGYRGDFPDP